MKVLGLIPTRLGSTRLPSKPLLEINNIPLIIHTYKRAKMAKLLDEVIICCDDKKIIKVADKFNSKSMLTSKKSKNGTERIYEAYKKLNKKYDLIIDIQGDNVLFLSRSKLPLEFRSNNKFYKKHLSIISFKPDALKKFNTFKKTPLEKSEDVELLRALEIGLKIKTVVLKGDSFSVDVFDDYKKAKEKFKKDKFLKKYK